MGDKRKNIKLRAIALLVCFLMTSCQAHHVSTYDPPLKKRDCMRLFSEILDIQKDRDSKTNTMGRFTRAFKQGHISREIYISKRDDWFRDEYDLRARVTSLYDIGYKHGCF